MLLKAFKIFLIFGAIVLVVFLFVAGAYLWFENNYNQKIYPGVHIGALNLGGKTVAQARTEINQRLDKLNQVGLVFDYGKNQAVIYPVASQSPQGDIVDILIDFNVDKTVQAAFAAGRSNNLAIALKDRFLTLFFPKPIDLVFTANQEKIINVIKPSFALIESADAKYYLGEQGELLISPERIGKKLDYEFGIQKMESNLRQMDFSNIVLNDKGNDVPKLTEADYEQGRPLAQGVLDLAPITLKYNGRIWTLNADTLVDWLVLQKNKSENNDWVFSVVLDREKISDYLEEEVKPQINSPATPPKYTLKDGKLEQVALPKIGQTLNILLAVESLSDLPNNHLKQLNLSVSKLLVEDNKLSSDLGVAEKLGTSMSQIIDSTQKRIFNIKQGASIINGLLIAPNEEFSLLKSLSPLDETNGYIKELVIQNGVMTPDYGGGLCQLSTTVFRAVLDAGLPVTERSNHSYWLHYYSPPGTDATIFDPSPDLKFMNDTGNYILVKTGVDNELNLTIDLWGTKDGRQITKTEPVVFNIVYAGKRLVPSATLAKGVQKCVSDAYNGADAYFDYKVTYANGQVKETRFNSHYTPHRAVCYIGE